MWLTHHTTNSHRNINSMMAEHQGTGEIGVTPALAGLIGANVGSKISISIQGRR
jgi:hypothetical protein